MRSVKTITAVTMKLVALLLLIFSSSIVTAQGTWTRKADFPFYTDQNFGFELGGYGYAGSGYRINSGALVYNTGYARYTPSTNLWTNLSASSSGVPYGGPSLGYNVNGNGYVVQNDQSNPAIISKYNGTAWSNPTTTWTGANRRSATGFAVGNIIYHVGGYINGGTYLQDCWAYDVNTNTWSQKASLPGAKRDRAMGFTIGDKGYICGGTTTGGILDDTWQYDTSSNNWIQKADMPNGVTEGTAFVINGKVYVVYALNVGGGSNFFQYQPVNDIWVPKNYMPAPHSSAFAFVINGFGYFGAGDSTNGRINTFWQYTPEFFNLTSVPTAACIGSTLNLSRSLSYTSDAGNVFTVELSDSAGSFTVPTVIGTVASTVASGTISVTVPSSTITGLHYRMRLKSSAPINYTEPSGYIEIANSFTPTVTIAATPSTPVCAGTSIALRATVTYGGTPTYQWALNNAAVGTNNRNYTAPNMQASDTVKLVVTSSISCASPNLLTTVFVPNIIAPAHNTVYQTICNGQTYAGHNTGGIYTDTLRNAAANGCDSFNILNLTVLPTIQSTITQSICAGGSYLGYSTAGAHTDTFRNASVHGCDSVRTLNLTVLQPARNTIAQSICAGQSYLGYNTAGIHVDTFRNAAANGCDSIRTLNLTILQPARSTIVQSICAGQGYLGYNTAGIHVDTFRNAAANGCDSIRTLNLTVNNSAASSMAASFCAGSSFTFNGTILTSAGIYRDTLINRDGCDSIVTLTLSLNSYSTGAITANICSGSIYNFYGRLLSNAGTYLDTIPGSNCDSIVTLTLTILQPNQSSITQSICAGQSFLGYHVAGIYIDTFQGAASNGCDSIRTLALNVLQTLRSTITQSICNGQSYLGYSAAGTYIDTLQGAASNGCDSIRTLNLSVQSVINTSVSQSICSGSSYHGHSSQGVYIDTFTAIGGCDSLRTLTLTILPVYRDTVTLAICQGENYHGQTSTGIYIDSMRTVNGCDSIIVTNLTVNVLPAQPMITQLDDTLKATQATAYQWFRDSTLISGATAQQLYLTQNGTYSIRIMNANGCSAFSEGYAVIGVGMDETDFAQYTNVSPNPSNGKFVLRIEVPTKQLKIELLSIQGQVLYAYVYETQSAFKKELEYTGLSKGIYLLKVSTESGVVVKRIVIE